MRGFPPFIDSRSLFALDLRGKALYVGRLLLWGFILSLMAQLITLIGLLVYVWLRGGWR